MKQPTLIRGDCFEELPKLEANSAHSIVTDPPYFLNFMGKKWDRATMPVLDSGLGHWLAGFADGEGCFTTRRSGDGFVCEFVIHIRADDLPVLKKIHEATGIGDIRGPTARADGGNPMVKWIVARQSDCAKLTAIFDAFPLRAKKANDFEIWKVAVRQWCEHEKGTDWNSIGQLAERLSAVKKYGASFNQEQFFHYRWAREAYRVLKPGGYLVAFGATRTVHRLAAGIEDAGFEIRDQLGWMHGQGFPKSKNFGGKGTSMKPAWEPIVLARKPIEGNVEENFAKWGTGMLAIDDCRIPFEDAADQLEAMAKNRHEVFGSGARQTHGIYGTEKRDRKNYIAAGRWPPNIMHDGGPESADVLGTAQRFFYCAKASSADRDAGLEWEELRPMARSNGAQSALSDSDEYTGGSTDIGLNKVQMRANSHPTVKPTSLMRWLCRLVTPAGGRIVDPMMGSGSTGRACQLEDFEFFGIELEEDYFNFARRRIDEATGELFAKR